MRRLASRSSPVLRKSIGALHDAEHQILFGTSYSRRDNLDERQDRAKRPDAATATGQGELIPGSLDSWLEALSNGSSGSSIRRIGAVVRRCVAERDLGSGIRAERLIHQLGLGTNVFLANLLVHMHGSLGALDTARAIFDAMPERNKFTWSIVLAAHARAGQHRAALELYEAMSATGVEIDNVLLATVIGICASLGDLTAGREIHARVSNSSSVIVHTALISMYGKCQKPDEAKAVFDVMPERDVVAWNAMIAANAQGGYLYCHRALDLFREMEQRGFPPDAFSYSSATAACAGIGPAALRTGREIHLKVLKSGLRSDVALDNSLLNMYARCGSIDEARKLFDGMRRRSVISWSTMVAAYTHAGHFAEALDLYHKMDSSSPSVSMPIRPNCITHAHALSACAAVGDLAAGRRIHARVVEEKWSGAAVIGSALIHMYAKCSCLDDARRVFDELRHKDLVCGNSMVAAYAQFGHLADAFGVYQQMVLDGTDPSSITLIGLVIGASHAGRVEDGRDYFVNFLDHHPEVELLWEHYMCLVDLLARCGWLADAEELVETMPFEPCVTGWVTLMNGCRIHGDVERAERAAEKVGELEPSGEGAQSILMLGTLVEKKWDVMSLIKRHIG